MSHGPSAPKLAPSDHLHHDHAPYEPVFVAGTASRAELDELLTRYPTKMAGLLPALWIVQRERGWVSEDSWWQRVLLRNGRAARAFR